MAKTPKLNQSDREALRHLLGTSAAVSGKQLASLLCITTNSFYKKVAPKLKALKFRRVHLVRKDEGGGYYVPPSQRVHVRSILADLPVP